MDRWVRLRLPEADDRMVEVVVAGARAAAVAFGFPGSAVRLADPPASARRSSSGGRRRRGGSRPRRASAATIAAWVRSRPEGRARPGEIRERFGMSEGTLRARRPALAELGIVYVDLFELSHYRAAPVAGELEIPLNHAVSDSAG